MSCISIFVLALICTSLYAESTETSNILIIFSWDKNLPWQQEIEKGFLLHYKAISSKPNLFIEYMDTGRFKGQKQIDIFKTYLESKYIEYPIDTVICESQSATKLLMSYPKLFETSKKYILNPGPLQVDLPSDTSMVIPVNTDYENAIKDLLEVSKGKTVYLIADTTVDCKKRVQMVLEIFSRLDPGQKVLSLVGLSMDELLDKVSTLRPTDSIIYFLLFFKDLNGTRYTPYEAVSQISQQAGAPVLLWVGYPYGERHRWRLHA